MAKKSVNEKKQVVMEEILSARQAVFTEIDFYDPNKMKYEVSNNLARAIADASVVERKLILSSFVFATAQHKEKRFTDDELDKGVKILIPNKDLGRMMGYEADSKHKYLYEAVREAVNGINSKGLGVLIEDEEEESLDYKVLYQHITYNKPNKGYTMIHFSAPISHLLFAQVGGNFDVVPYLIIKEMWNRGGVAGSAVALHSVLHTYLYQAQNSPDKRTEVIINYEDLRGQLGFIRTDIKEVRTIMTDVRYKEYLKYPTVAIERKNALRKLDEPVKKAIEDYDKAKPANFKTDKEKKEWYEKRRNLVSRLYLQYDVWGDFRKRILAPIQKFFVDGINENKGRADFMFEFHPISYNKEIVAVKFDIYTIEGYRTKQRGIGVQMNISDILEIPEKKVRTRKPAAEDKSTELTEFIYSIPKSKRIVLSPSDIIKISKLGDIELIKANYKYVCNIKKGEEGNHIGYIIKAIKENYAGYGVEEEGEEEVKGTEKPKKKTGQKPKNNFHNYEQRQYDYEELEKELLSMK